ncbi:MAG: hypothetical protein H6Q16_996 [Bacteroidetes bacterium]|nr:hypothetical protein [Bacteroidota bacterium]
MKTKNLLFLILLLGLSFNSFSQEEVVIKQVITNNLGDFTNISTIEINTDCPVMIKSGKEDAVYLVGDIDKSKSSDYKGFCVLKENVLSINSPYKGDKKDLTITIELSGSVYNYFLGENSKVAINDNLIYDNSGTFSIQKNSELSVDGIVKLENLNIVAKEDAKIKFRSINVEELNIDLDKRSVLILNGKINTINIKQAEGSHIAGDYKYENIIGDSYDLVNIIKGDVNKPEYPILISDTTADREYNNSSISWNPNNANLIIGNNSKAKIIFSDNIKEDYISNYPIKGYEKGKLIIQDDYPVDLELTIRKDIGNITLKEGAKVTIDSEIKGKTRSYYLYNHAELIFNNKVEVNELEVSLNHASKAGFKNLKANKIYLQGNGSSELEINGEIGILDRYKYDDVNLKGDYKIDSIKERKLKMFTIETPIPFNFNTENTKGDENSEKIKAQKQGKDKLNFSFQLAYGILGWSNRVSGVDDLFSSPKGQYTLRYSDSWSFGFRYDAKISKRWTISSGIGYESNIFRFENNVVLTTINGDRRIDFETNNLIDAESKLVARYVTVPLFIKYRVVKNFTLHAGAIAGVNFRTSSTGFKRDYEKQDKDIEERWGTKYDNFKPIKLDVQAGFGWNDINFYAKYSLIPLFKNNKEVEVYPYSVGVSFGL